mmetsp:Transcript_25310/g.48008  ORF Transcript_25310/g.48008 Transcript_25310/m.48008 type:complete len:88 (-) Transcript_25310:154-417(-)|eukprot:scaffold7012_cov157-Amphora_coffeaeformis.AAC.20
MAETTHNATQETISNEGVATLPAPVVDTAIASTQTRHVANEEVARKLVSDYSDQVMDKFFERGGMATALGLNSVDTPRVKKDAPASR